MLCVAAASRSQVHEAGMQATVHKLDFAEGRVTQKKNLRRQPVMSLSMLIQHYPPVAPHHALSGTCSCHYHQYNATKLGPKLCGDIFAMVWAT